MAVAIGSGAGISVSDLMADGDLLRAADEYLGWRAKEIERAQRRRR